MDAFWINGLQTAPRIQQVFIRSIYYLLYRNLIWMQFDSPTFSKRPLPRPMSRTFSKKLSPHCYIALGLTHINQVVKLFWGGFYIWYAKIHLNPPKFIQVSIQLAKTIYWRECVLNFTLLAPFRKPVQQKHIDLSLSLLLCIADLRACLYPATLLFRSVKDCDMFWNQEASSLFFLKMVFAVQGLCGSIWIYFRVLKTFGKK